MRWQWEWGKHDTYTHKCLKKVNNRNETASRKHINSNNENDNDNKMKKYQRHIPATIVKRE